MTEDIRDKTHIGSRDILALNFINPRGRYVFRRFYRQGLRSLIVGVLHPDDVFAETQGVYSEGILQFPQAEPIRIFRIYKSRFANLEEALKSIGDIKILERFLGDTNCARSFEFLVSYQKDNQFDWMLGGIQEYIQGMVLDPWGFIDSETLGEYCLKVGSEMDENLLPDQSILAQRVRRKTANFINKVKTMIRDSGLIPDLAGAGNLILTPQGDIKLVDNNNISPVSFSPEITVDDFGYPVTDKSVEALSLLETKILGRQLDLSSRIYSTFLDNNRMQEVTYLEKTFHDSHDPEAVFYTS